MKRKIQNYLSGFVLLMILQLNGQQNDFTSNISLSMGFTFAGPVGPMSKYLVEQGFDAQNVSVFFFGPIDYPVKTKSGGSLALTYTWEVKSDKRINIQLGFSDLGRIAGYSSTQGSIAFEFETVYGAVFYSYQREVWDLRIGPSVLLNTTDSDPDSFERSKAKETKISIGLLAGIGLQLWSSNRTYGLLNCDYIYALPNKFGPFTANAFENGRELPENSFSFKHATASFTFGVHL
ncbi:hypothetical protein [Maribacter aestuarii]|uniref:hypothetical protein n=1 Tax=Maribacter aestuarii TaxID=1130723 RepID=UPI00248C4751|nr:hypothetical protein [Maribacter aestuarii]